MQSIAFLIAVFEFVLLIFSLSVHECAHAWTASHLGDQTARLQGRVTLNPVYHVDPIGTLLFPALMIFGPFIGFSFFSGMLVGWAKPTPVITRNFRKIRRDDNLTTLAGPASNLCWSPWWRFCCWPWFRSWFPAGTTGHVHVCRVATPWPCLPACRRWCCSAVLAIVINLRLFFFNLLPIPPLDGSRMLRNMLPYNAVQVYDRIPIWVQLPAHDLRGRLHPGCCWSLARAGVPGAAWLLRRAYCAGFTGPASSE